MKWTGADIPDLTGRTVIVTGANSGLGYETTLALARKGAQVVMACRNPQKAQTAYNAIRQQVPQAVLDVQPLDLASQRSVRAFVEMFRANYQQLDVLMNNAGVMAPPRRETVEGFELQFGTNHLGHFALTGLLLDLIVQTPDSRIVTTTSVAHHMGVMRFEDLQRKREYDRWQAYGQSKLANLLFALELQRRLTAAGYDTLSIAAHPGYSNTHLQTSGPETGGMSLSSVLFKVTNPMIAQSGAMGALPQLYAATAPDAPGGTYYGPGLLGWRGYPQARKANPKAYDETVAKRLWEVSEGLTGVYYDALTQQAA